MTGGYVLNFSDRTFRQFFAEELNINIDDPIYAKNGGSKAKRLRCFLQTVGKSTAVRALNELWEYREALRLGSKQSEAVENSSGRLLAIIKRLQCDQDSSETGWKEQPKADLDRVKIVHLRSELLALSQLDPQPRGFAFEKFLRQLFDVFGLEPREAFRIRGEQIDGSFQLSEDTYLLEAKWQSLPCGVAELHTFHGKIEQKAAWTRGLFISNSGFTEDGLVAFGRGKRVICMDGLDLNDLLDREIALNDVLDRKLRRAAETGSPFTRVRDLFPV